MYAAECNAAVTVSSVVSQRLNSGISHTGISRLTAVYGRAALYSTES